MEKGAGFLGIINFHRTIAGKTRKRLAFQGKKIPTRTNNSKALTTIALLIFNLGSPASSLHPTQTFYFFLYPLTRNKKVFPIRFFHH